MSRQRQRAEGAGGGERRVASETLDFVVVRSDNEKILASLDIVPVEQPETVF